MAGHQILTTMLLWICTSSSPVTGLRCRDCVGECANPGACETQGKCFIRRDVNGILYRGCADAERWGELDIDYTGCSYQDYLGWNGQRVYWCFCRTDYCNQNPIQNFLGMAGHAPGDEKQGSKESGSVLQIEPTAFPFASSSGRPKRPNKKTSDTKTNILDDISEPTSLPFTLIPETSSNPPDQGHVDITQLSDNSTSNTSKPGSGMIYPTIPSTTAYAAINDSRANTDVGSIVTTGAPDGTGSHRNNGNPNGRAPGGTNGAPNGRTSIGNNGAKNSSDSGETNGAPDGTGPSVNNGAPNGGSTARELVEKGSRVPKSGGEISGQNGPVSHSPTPEENGHSTQRACPVGFEAVEMFQGCYRFMQESRDFTSSRERCHQLDSSADLVSINTMAEFNYLVKRISKELRQPDEWQGWWTSGRYNPHMREFVWSTSGRVISRVDLRWWKSLLIQPYPKTCVWLVPHVKFRFGNYDCQQRAKFICKAHMVT